MIAPTAAPGALHVGERRQHHLRAGGLRQELHRDLDHHAEQSFGAGHQREQVVAGGVERIAADGDALAVGGDHGELQDVVHGEAVLETVEPARVLRHVAADAARDLRGRVRCVVEAERRHVLRDGEVAHPGLDPRRAADGVDLQDPVELRETQQHPVGERQRASGQPRRSSKASEMDGFPQPERTGWPASARQWRCSDRADLE